MAALLAAAPMPTRAAPDASRQALVIGNDTYASAPLGNAVNDAKAMAALLGEAGFTVDLRTNAAREPMVDATRRLATTAAGSEARFVFFYYAGHGAQLDWRNFLLPVDAQVNRADDLTAHCLDFGILMREFAKVKGKTFVVVLDACRDNPFGGTFRTPQKGLSQFDAPAGSLLAFSTAPGTVAADGTGGGGLYTQNLVRELSVKDARIEDALKRTRLAVRIASRGAQIPWESTSLESDVYLFPTRTQKLSEKALEEEFVRELATWNRVKGSKQPDDWVAYLREYPGGKFSEIAQNRLAHLFRVEEQRLAAAKPPPAADPSAAAAPPSPAAPAAVAASPPAPVVVTTSPPAAATAPPAQVAAARPRPPVDGGRPQLVIGPGLPVPVLMRPSPNPASAGTYQDFKVFSVGDEFIYAVSDPLKGSKVERQAERVTRVDEEADRIEVNGGETVLDSMGNLLEWRRRRYDPRSQSMPAELQVGHKWSARYQMAFDGGTYEGYFDHRVAAREIVSVPAGEFDSFKLEGEGFNVTTGARIILTTWVVPGLAFPLRSQRTFQARNSPFREVELRELVSCRQMRWSAA